MARPLNLYALGQTLTDVLSGDEGVLAAAKTITYEEDMPRANELMPWIGVYVEEAADNAGPIAAGGVQRFRVSFNIQCWVFSLEGPKAAADMVAGLQSVVLAALMRNPTWGGVVELYRVTRIVLDSAQSNAGFVMGDSINLYADLKTSIFS